MPLNLAMVFSVGFSVEVVRDPVRFSVSFLIVTCFETFDFPAF